jgi:hypothetical protein
MEKYFLDNLIRRLRAGRDSARMDLWREYEPHVVRMVRRYLRPGTTPSPMRQRIRAVAEAVGDDVDDDGQFERRVAWRFCESLLEPAGGSEVVRLPHRETLCA